MIQKGQIFLGSSLLNVKITFFSLFYINVKYLKALGCWSDKQKAICGHPVGHREHSSLFPDIS